MPRKSPVPSGPPKRRIWLQDWFQILRIGFCGAAFVAFGLGWVLLAWVVLPLAYAWPGSTFQRHRRCQWIVTRTWVLFHDYMRVTGLIDYDPRRQRITLAGPAVVISNHPTLVDVTALLSAIGPACFIVKRPLFRNPVLGPLMRLCGHICNHADAADGRGVVDQAVARIREGHTVLLFPEGTRSPVGGLDRFRLGAFEIARLAGVPLVPIAIKAQPPALFKGIPWHAIPRITVQMSLTSLPIRRLEAGRDPSQSPAELAALKEARDEVRRQIQAALDIPDKSFVAPGATKAFPSRHFETGEVS
jgi:1-acyl-sn-glycerol-3-phosphate acyltransferase